MDFLLSLAARGDAGLAINSQITQEENYMKARLILILALALILNASASLAQRAKKATGGPQSIHVDLSKEKVGGESKKFLSVVGNWVIVQDGDKKTLAVDGRQWMRGQPAGGLAQKAREIYGSRHEEFIDNVKAFAYFPYAVARDVDDFTNGEISMQFKLVAGQLDQCAGILFNLKPNGDYLTVRFNGKEDNVVLWTFNKGKRSFVKRGAENVPLAMNQWNALKIAVHGTTLQAFLNGKQLLDYTLAEPVSGKIGVWSKTDSVSYFADYTVTPATN
jgi:3-keto-disaccharide hydrolase